MVDLNLYEILKLSGKLQIALAKQVRNFLINKTYQTKTMIKKIIPVLLITIFAGKANAQYLETFSTSNKGYLLNCVNALSAINWSLSPWDAGGTCQLADLRDPTDYFNTTAAGVLESIDLDQEVYWESPLLNTIAAPTVSLSVGLSWVGFDSDVAANSCLTDFIRVQYSVNGAAYVMVPNQAGGNACATVSYPFGAGGPFSASATIFLGGIAGGSNLKIRVVVFTNANAEIVTIDNVSVPQAGVIVLPVNLISFAGKLNPDKTATLQWKIAQQQDAKEFTVEESNDGITFRTLGTITAGAGDTYSITDAQVNTGKNYYRLKTLELSGKVNYSNIILISLKPGIVVSMYPNPVKDNLTIQQFGTIQNRTAMLSDVTGNILQQIKLTSLQQEVNMKIYPNGIYFLKLEDGKVFKVVKQ
jgi:hypothetical protein